MRAKLTNESVFKPVDLSTIFKDKKYTVEDSRDYVTDVYKLVFIKHNFFKALSISDFISDETILSIIAKAFAKKQNPYEPAKTIQKYLKDKGFHVNESMFAPKSEDEIIKNLEDTIEIHDHQEAQKQLKAGILRKSLAYVKFALKHGATVIDGDPMQAGALWLSFNDEAGDDIYKELINHPSTVEAIKKPENENFRASMLGKLMELGNMEMVKYVLDRFNFSKIDIRKSLYHSPTTFKNSPETYDYLHSKLNESIFKPKSTDEINTDIQKDWFDHVFFANKYNLNPKEYDVPLIANIMQQIKTDPRFSSMHTNNITESNGVKSVYLFFKFEDTNFIVKQDENSDFVVSMTRKGSWLYSSKIRSFETLIKFVKDESEVR